MPKSNCFRKIFGSERNHGSQTLPKSVCQNFYPNFPLIQNKLSWKTCPAIISKFLGLFIRTLTPDNMHSPHNWEKFRQRLQRQLSQKRKLISGIFVAFLKSTWNFVYFEKKKPASEFKYIWSSSLRKIFFFECQKATTTEQASGVSPLKVPEHCPNPHGSSFVIVSH